MRHTASLLSQYDPPMHSNELVHAWPRSSATVQVPMPVWLMLAQYAQSTQLDANPKMLNACTHGSPGWPRAMHTSVVGSQVSPASAHENICSGRHAPPRGDG